MPEYKKKFAHLAAYQEKQEKKEEAKKRRYKNKFGTCKCGAELIPQGNCTMCPVCGNSDCSL